MAQGRENNVTATTRKQRRKQSFVAFAVAATSTVSCSCSQEGASGSQCGRRTGQRSVRSLNSEVLDSRFAAAKKRSRKVGDAGNEISDAMSYTTDHDGDGVKFLLEGITYPKFRLLGAFVWTTKGQR